MPRHLTEAYRNIRNIREMFELTGRDDLSEQMRCVEAQMDSLFFAKSDLWERLCSAELEVRAAAEYAMQIYELRRQDTEQLIEARCRVRELQAEIRELKKQR